MCKTFVLKLYGEGLAISLIYGLWIFLYVHTMCRLEATALARLCVCKDSYEFLLSTKILWAGLYNVETCERAANKLTILTNILKKNISYRRVAGCSLICLRGMN